VARRVVAEHPAEQLAGRGAGDLVDEADAAQALVGSDPVGHPGLELGRAHLGPRGHRRQRQLPASGSGRGTTAASATAGWAQSSASSSAGATWAPLYLMSSLSRSTTNRWPSASREQRAPVRSQPSGAI